MVAKYPGNCSKCGQLIQTGEECDYDRNTKKIRHYTCPAELPLDLDSPIALAERLGYRPVKQ